MLDLDLTAIPAEYRARVLAIAERAHAGALAAAIRAASDAPEQTALEAARAVVARVGNNRTRANRAAREAFMSRTTGDMIDCENDAKAAHAAVWRLALEAEEAALGSPEPPAAGAHFHGGPRATTPGIAAPVVTIESAEGLAVVLRAIVAYLAAHIGAPPVDLVLQTIIALAATLPAGERAPRGHVPELLAAIAALVKAAPWERPIIPPTLRIHCGSQAAVDAIAMLPGAQQATQQIDVLGRAVTINHVVAPVGGLEIAAQVSRSETPIVPPVPDLVPLPAPPAEPWRPKPGDRVRTGALGAAFDTRIGGHDRRRANAAGNVTHPGPRLKPGSGRAAWWWVRHDDGTEAPYVVDELRPEPAGAQGLTAIVDALTEERP